MNLRTAIGNVERSLRLFGKDSGKAVSGGVISYSMRTHERGHAGDPGVAVWFTWDGEQICIPVDRFTSIAENMQAIHKIIEARRVELRLGSLALIKATFTGFKALPKARVRTWREVLGFPEGYQPSEAQLLQRWRELAGRHHPDRGGSSVKMGEINAARDMAKKELRL